MAGRSALARKVNGVFFVRCEVCGFLDVSRLAFVEIASSVETLVEDIRASGLNVQMAFSSKHGCSLKCSSANWEAAPAAAKATMSQFILKGKNVTCISASLAALNVRLMDAANDTLLLSQQVLDGCLSFIRERIHVLQGLGEALSLLDLLQSFASTIAGSSEAPWTRPLFTSGDGPLAIQSGRHPVLEQRCLKDKSCAPFVANHTFLSEAASLVVVSGANTGGKSTYLRQCALLAILAHSGCYVPASFASIRLLDRILCVGTSGEDNEGCSSFTLECRELQAALSGSTKDSLILIDELGRSTSTADGFAIAFAACERLLAKGVLTLCASHLERLDELSHLYGGAKLAHLSLELGSSRLLFTHQLVEGGAVDRPHYGCLLARTCGFPATVVARADALVGQMERAAAESAISVSVEKGKKQTLYAVAQRLLALHKASSLSDEELRAALRRLQATAQAIA